MFSMQITENIISSHRTLIKTIEPYTTKDLSYCAFLLISRVSLPFPGSLTMFLFHCLWRSDAFQHQGWEFSDVIYNISKVHISMSKSLSTMVNNLQTLLQSALLNGCQRRLMSQEMVSFCVCATRCLPFFSEVSEPELCSQAGMEGIWFPNVSGWESHLWVWSLQNRIPHCVANKLSCLLSSATKYQLTWQQKRRVFSFYKFNS